MLRWTFRIFLAAGLFAAAGCNNTLETGYKPDPLNMSASQRKAMYADPYSQAQAEAQQDSDSNSSPSSSHAPGRAY